MTTRKEKQRNAEQTWTQLLSKPQMKNIAVNRCLPICNLATNKYVVLFTTRCLGGILECWPSAESQEMHAGSARGC